MKMIKYKASDSTTAKKEKCTLGYLRMESCRDLERLYCIIITNTSENSKMIRWTDSDAMNLLMAILISGSSKKATLKEEEFFKIIEKATNT